MMDAERVNRVAFHLPTIDGDYHLIVRTATTLGR